MTFDTSKAKAPGRQSEGFQENTSKPSNFSAKSCAIEAQHERILQALSRRPHTSFELTSLLGIYHPPRRIKELREQGHAIQTDRVVLVDAWGYRHPRCALYSLGA